MKKKTLAILLIAFYLVACAESKSKNGGGQDLGGGNAVSSDAPTQENLKNYLGVIESKKVPLFNSIKLVGLIAHRILSLDNKTLNSLPREEVEKLRFQKEIFDLLFQDSEKFDRILINTTIEIQDQQPCYDAKGHPVDGSIYATNANQICLSTKRLQEKLKKDNFEIQLLSLYIHEISHLFGSTENQAQKLQDQILQIGPNFRNYLSFMYKPPQEITSLLQSMRDQADEVFKQTSKDKICQNLQGVFDKAYQILFKFNFESVMISYLKQEDIVRTHTILILAGYAKDYCESDWSPGKQLRMQKWKGKTEVEIREIYPDPLTLIPSFESPEKILIFSQYLLADLSSVRLKSVKENDQSTMHFNLKVLIQLLDQIQIKSGSDI